MRVSIHAIVDGQPEKIGEVHWNPGTKITWHPTDKGYLDFADLLEEQIMLPGGERVAAGTDPQRWVESLHLHYKGSYLWADKATE